jgi:hypothetical protein
MTEIVVKCGTLLLSRIWALRNKEWSLTNSLMCNWDFIGNSPNPPLPHRIPTKAAHFRQYNIDMAYVAESETTETFKQYKRRIYGTLRKLAANSEDATSLRVTRKYPATCWERVWKNLHKAEASDTVTSTW